MNSMRLFRSCRSRRENLPRHQLQHDICYSIMRDSPGFFLDHSSCFPTINPILPTNRFPSHCEFERIHDFLASAGRPSKSSFPSRPTLPGPDVFTPNCSPSVLKLLSLVAGPRSPVSLPPPYETSLWTPPEPTLTLLASAEFQSDSTGGWSGRGRFCWRSLMIPAWDVVSELVWGDILGGND